MWYIQAQLKQFEQLKETTSYHTHTVELKEAKIAELMVILNDTINYYGKTAIRNFL